MRESLGIARVGLGDCVPDLFGFSIVALLLLAAIFAAIAVAPVLSLYELGAIDTASVRLSATYSVRPSPETARPVGYGLIRWP